MLWVLGHERFLQHGLVLLFVLSKALHVHVRHVKVRVLRECARYAKLEHGSRGRSSLAARP